MKKLVTMLVLMAAGSSVFAQSNKEDVDLIQSVFGKEKKQIVAGFIQLDPTTQDAFWKLYDEYETSRKELGKKRIALLEKYAANYATLNDVSSDEIIKEMQSLQASTDKLIVQYYGKIKKASGVKPAAQFYQLEEYFLSKVRATLMENIPFIGQLDGK